MEYTIIHAVLMDDLVEEVTDLIKEGWEPQGGIACNAFERKNNYMEDEMIVDLYQAMIRRPRSGDGE